MIRLHKYLKEKNPHSKIAYDKQKNCVNLQRITKNNNFASSNITSITDNKFWKL